eukprot:TRINITY_DN3438_c0_g1_i2.p1 TRINITY_DN3438_c0_g1~~TRINITY_DN3438_c0_g1_i2.p1  ORF type:complete len:650 (-),score=163.11 TRINITY_DN3438_c0_g1_i2:65-2014(-)
MCIRDRYMGIIHKFEMQSNIHLPEYIPHMVTVNAEGYRSQPAILHVSTASCTANNEDVDDKAMDLNQRGRIYPQNDNSVILIGSEGSFNFYSHVQNVNDPTKNEFFCIAGTSITYNSKDRILIGAPSAPIAAHPKLTYSSIASISSYFQNLALGQFIHSKVIHPASFSLEKEEEGEKAKTFLVKTAKAKRGESDQQRIYRLRNGLNVPDVHDTVDGLSNAHGSLVLLTKDTGQQQNYIIALWSAKARKLVKKLASNLAQAESKTSYRLAGPNLAYFSKGANDTYIANGIRWLNFGLLPVHQTNVPPEADVSGFVAAPDGFLVHNDQTKSQTYYSLLEDRPTLQVQYTKNFLYAVEPLNDRYSWGLFRRDFKIALVENQTGKVKYHEFRSRSVEDHIFQGFRHRFTFDENTLGYVTEAESNQFRKYILVHTFELVSGNIIRSNLYTFQPGTFLSNFEWTLFGVNLIEREYVIRQVTKQGDFIGRIPANDEFTLRNIFAASANHVVLKLANVATGAIIFQTVSLTDEEPRVTELNLPSGIEILAAGAGLIVGRHEQNLIIQHVTDHTRHEIHLANEATAATFLGQSHSHLAVLLRSPAGSDILIVNTANGSLKTVNVQVPFRQIKAIPNSNLIHLSGYEFFLALNVSDYLP